ncbi:hypothetical protein ACHQM5_022487 [Ranunculus cassubicifolius]
MFKLSHILRSSRNAGSEELLMGKARKTVNALWANNFASEAASTGNRTNKIFSDYTVFKGKAALSVSPVLPKLGQTETSSKYDKKGAIMLTFWPAIGERKYNWEKRQLFALSPTELGSLISLEAGKSCEFFHDPFMKSSNAGQIKKSLTISPMGKDDGGYFFTLSVVNGIHDTNERFSVPVSKAEFTVMRTAFSYILPHIMGWDQVIRQEQPSNGMNQGRQQEMRVSPKYEWDR